MLGIEYLEIKRIKGLNAGTSQGKEGIELKCVYARARACKSEQEKED